jgi:YggT family protein
MSSDFLFIFIRAIFELLIWIVIISSILSFFVSPYHPVREALDRIVAPLLNPIRNLIPPAGGLDFSPLILILLLNLIERLLILLIS